MTLPIYLSDASGKRYRSQKDYDYITANMHQTVVDMVEAAGYTASKHAVPDMLPGKASLEGYGGLILFGGFDIDSAFYTADNMLSGFAYPKIDMYELELIYAAVSSGLPVLGICRGMQLINVAFGGTLHEDIGHLTTMKHNNFGAGAYEHRALAHEVVVQNSSVLTNGVYNVASSHHQAVDHVGDNLKVTSWGEDGIIEMIENADLNVIGVQWHPEAAHVPQSDTLSPLVASFLAAVPETPVYKNDRELIQLHMQPLFEPAPEEEYVPTLSSYYTNSGFSRDDYSYSEGLSYYETYDDVPAALDDRTLDRHFFLDEDDYELQEDAMREDAERERELELRFELQADRDKWW